MSKQTLYVIADEVLALEEILTMDGGEITEDHEVLMNEVFTSLSEKVDSVVGLVQKFEDEVDVAKKHEKRIKEWRSVRENAIERIKGYCIDSMRHMEKQKLKGEMCQVSLRKPSDVVEVEDQDSIPVEFLKRTVTVDKAAVKKALKEGTEVPGAKLGKGKESIQFKLGSLK